MERSIDRLAEVYDRLLVEGAQLPPPLEPAPEPLNTEVEGPPPISNPVLVVVDGHAELEGIAVELTEEEVATIRTIVATRIANKIEEQLNEFRGKHALRKKR